MPKTPTEEFSKNPEQFLQQNLVRIPSFAFDCDGKPAKMKFKLEPGTLYTCINAPSFTFKRASDSTPGFFAYYLPYKGADSIYTTLGDQADIFFTDTLSGCSVNFGRGKVPIVGHLNFQAGTVGAPTIDQTRIDSELSWVRQASPGGHGTLTRNEYQGANPDGMANFFGVRDKKTGYWKFFYQLVGWADGSSENVQLLHLKTV